MFRIDNMIISVGGNLYCLMSSVSEEELVFSAGVIVVLSELYNIVVC